MNKDYEEILDGKDEQEKENAGMLEALRLLAELGKDKMIPEEEMFRQEQAAERLRAESDGLLLEVLARIYRKMMLRRREMGGTVSLAIARTLSQAELSLWQEICMRKPEMASYLDAVRCCMELQVSCMMSAAVSERSQREIRAILLEYGQKILEGEERPETEEWIRLLDVLILANVQEREAETLERAEKLCMMRLEAASVYQEGDANAEQLDVLANGYIIFGNVLREMKKREDAVWMMEMGCVLHKKAVEIDFGYVAELLEDYVRLADTLAENRNERGKALMINRRAMMLAAKIADKKKDARILESMCRLYTNAAILLLEGGDAEQERSMVYAKQAVNAGERLMEIHPVESSYALLMKAMYIAGHGRHVTAETEAYYRERAEMYMEYASGPEAQYCS